MRKDDDARVNASLIEYATHIHSAYPPTRLIFEPYVADEIHEALPCPVYTTTNGEAFAEKVDLTTTLGGDGTILHAASLFAAAKSVPPILSFTMGTLGFLGEWKFHEYKRAFRDVFMSGSPSPFSSENAPETTDGGSGPRSVTHPAWTNMRGKSMGSSRTSRILMRNRLSIGLFDSNGARLPRDPSPSLHNHTANEDVFALNEVLLHRGALPHLVHITILIGRPPHQRTLTTAIADGFLVSTPTGSTAYSLSSGGSIVHPLVSSILLTPICPRSLSFRPLVLPANTQVTLRIDEENRGKEIEVSVDGVRRPQGLKTGMEVRVVGEEIIVQDGEQGMKEWSGGVPIVVRSGGDAGGEDPWVGGLNSLLKFNYPFGEDG